MRGARRRWPSFSLRRGSSRFWPRRARASSSPAPSPGKPRYCPSGSFRLAAARASATGFCRLRPSRPGAAGRGASSSRSRATMMRPWRSIARRASPKWAGAPAITIVQQARPRPKSSPSIWPKKRPAIHLAIHLVAAFAAAKCNSKPAVNIRKNCPNNALAQRQAVSIIRRDFPPRRRLEQNMSEEAKATELLPLVTDIVAAHLSNNNVPSNELPQLIREVYQALAAASGGGPAPKERPAPAVSIKKSITPEYIVCLEDGKKLKMLKRRSEE